VSAIQNHCGIRILLATTTALLLSTPAYGAGDDPADRSRTGHWDQLADGISKTVQATSTSGGVDVAAGVQGRRGTGSTSPGSTNEPIREQLRGGGPSAAGGRSVNWGGSSGSRPLPSSSLLPLIVPSTGGANTIVPGGPISTETLANGQQTTFGGQAIGGWTMDTTPGGGTSPATPWAPVGPVPHLNPYDVAVEGEAHFPVPAIALKANPDPGRVNIDSWFWAEGYDGRVISYSWTKHASHNECRVNDQGQVDCRTVDDSVTVDIHLMPKHYAWTFGDDRNNTAGFNGSKGLGRAYTDPDPRDASPVAHAYHWSSINFLNQGGYPITLTIDWSAEFSANGGGFQGIPEVTHTYAGHHQVRQIQSIVSR
jgi:hypothetical protein